MKIKKNQVFEVKIEDLNNLGYGVAHIDGMAVFVDGTAVGDEAKVKIIKTANTYLAAKLEELTVSSPVREESKCRARACGGCAYLHIKYEEEKRLKTSYVKSAFHKAGVDCTVCDVISDDKTERYRNKAIYPVGYEGGRYFLGFFAPKSHRTVEVVDCLLQPKIFSQISDFIRERFSFYKVSVYDEKTGVGDIRHVYLREGSTGEISLVFVVLRKKSEIIKKIALEACDKFKNIKCAMLNINKENTNVILSDEYVNIYGDGYINEVLSGVKLRVSPASFLQVNHSMAEMLYSKAKELANLTPETTVADLYCGTGSIGLTMAKEVKKLVGIEIVNSAIECARINAKENGIDNAVFYAGDASDSEKFFEKAQKDGFNPDVIILDPPRKGTAPELINYIADKLKTEKIVYISCNPDTLARDAKLFLQKGYSLSPVYPFDLFPRTGHCEAVCSLSRKKQ